MMAPLQIDQQISQTKMDLSTASNTSRSQTSISDSRVQLPLFPSGQIIYQPQNPPAPIEINYMETTRPNMNFPPKRFSFNARYVPGRDQIITIIITHPDPDRIAPNMPPLLKQTVLTANPQGVSIHQYPHFQQLKLVPNHNQTPGRVSFQQQ